MICVLWLFSTICSLTLYLKVRLLGRFVAVYMYQYRYNSSRISGIISLSFTVVGQHTTGLLLATVLSPTSSFLVRHRSLEVLAIAFLLQFHPSQNALSDMLMTLQAAQINILLVWCHHVYMNLVVWIIWLWWTICCPVLRGSSPQQWTPYTPSHRFFKNMNKMDFHSCYWQSVTFLCIVPFSKV